MNNDNGSLVPLTILLVEDNADIQEATHLIFDLHWPEAKIIQALNGMDGLLLMKTWSPDLIILDLGLPDIDGMKVLKEIRALSNVPVIILTVRGEEMDKVRGLELGADDFIIKPFNHNELLARIKVVMRHRSTVTEKSPHLALSSTLKIDLSTDTVLRDDRPIKLTGTEFSLLKYLAANEGRVITDEEILMRIWGNEYVDCSEYLEVYVRRLRDKLEEDPYRPRIILREGGGYRFIQEG